MISLKRDGFFYYLSVIRSSFFVNQENHIIEDKINLLFPWRSERSLRIVGTPGVYSTIPLFPFQHNLKVYTYCKQILDIHSPSYYKHALILGCGGGSVARYLLQKYHRIHIDIVELSPEIIAACKKFFLHKWESTNRVSYHCVDAIEYINTLHKYEFIFCDLFIKDQLSEVVLDSSFATKLREMLCCNGLLVINTGKRHMQQVDSIYHDIFHSTARINQSHEAVIYCNTSIYK